MHHSPLCLTLAFVVSSGCTTAKVTYGPRPLPPLAPTAAEQCVVDNRIEVGSASTTIVWREGDWSNRRSIGGVAFYKDGDRLSPIRTLSMLDDHALEGSYKDRRRALGKGVGWARFRYKGGMYVMGVSVVVSLGALFAGDAGLPMALGGLGGTLIGTTLLLTSYGRLGDMKTHDAYGKFIFEEDMAARAGAAVDRYNLGVVNRCLGGQ